MSPSVIEAQIKSCESFNAFLLFVWYKFSSYTKLFSDIHMIRLFPPLCFCAVVEQHEKHVVEYWTASLCFCVSV